MNTLLLYLIIVPLIVLVLLALNLFSATNKQYEEKLSSYECG
jgi:NADH:ubiquinone oxidoreductase subunit 3 (subunit A)